MNDIVRTLTKIKPRELSGAKTINAYSYQLDICAYLILELLKTEKDFSVYVEYLDDIVILDDKNNPNSIIFYQVKTSNKSISMSHIINENWLEYMEMNLNSFSESNAKSVFLTNQEITFSKKKFGINDEYKFSNQEIMSLEDFTKNNCDIEDKNKIDEVLKKCLKKEANYSNLYIAQSKFSLVDHENQLLAELTNYLFEIDQTLDLAALRAIYNAFINKIKSLGKEVYSPPIIEFSELQSKKSFDRGCFDALYKRVKDIMIPTDFKEIYLFAKNIFNYTFDGKNYASLKSEYIDFTMEAIKHRTSYERILTEVKKINFASMENNDCITKSLTELSKNSIINEMDMYKKYGVYILLVAIYKKE